jgi:hypothetical protein
MGLAVRDMISVCGSDLSSIHLSTDLIGRRFEVPLISQTQWRHREPGACWIVCFVYKGPT